MYYDKVYITTKSADDYEDNTVIEFDSIGKPFTLFGKDLPQTLEIYQDIYKQCLLFSYSNKDLSQMISKIGDINIDNYLFVLTKDGLKFISYKNLKMLKKYSISHSYDSTLCKQ